MKIALLNLANNITDIKTVSSGETIYIKKMLEMIGHEVDIISKSKGQYTISFEEVFDINIYERLWVINGAINFFGGKENQIIINNFKLMVQYKSKIDYLLTDLRLPFKQLWPSIEKRDWGYSKEEVWVNSKIRVISQSHNEELIQKLIPNSEFVYFPLERYILLFPQNDNLLSFKSTDLIYGGSFRAGNRLKKMKEYFFDTEYSVELFGNIKEKQFDFDYQKAPLFSGKVDMEEVINKNSEGYSSIIIGDDNYNDNMLTLRVWEVLLSDAIILIDNDFDPNHKIMEQEWFYVKNKNEVNDKIKYIKRSEKTYDALIKFQKQRTLELFDQKEYLNRLGEII